MMEQETLERLLLAQQLITEKVSKGVDFKDCLHSICESIEVCLAPMSGKSSILLLDGVSLRHGAAPNLPKSYCEAVDGVQIGASVGSCGTAAFLGERIIVSDIATDPLWVNFKDLALEYNLLACWSTPIISSDGEVLGTFAIYYSEVRLPEPEDLKLIDHFTGLSRIAIEKELSHLREEALHRQLLASNERLNAFISVLPDLGLILDEEGTYVDIYGGKEELIARGAKDIIGKKIADIIEPDTAQKFLAAVASALKNFKLEVLEYELFVKGGLRTFEGRICPIKHYLPDEPNKAHVLWIARDITEKKHAEENIERLAFYDPLTGLPNRRLFNDRLQHTVERVAQNNAYSALLFLDLDNFKRINDSLGHGVGDQLLERIAESLKLIVSGSDTLSRFGGDEFVILQESVDADLDSSRLEASRLAEKLLDVFAKSFNLLDAHYVVRASIGICMIHGAGETVSEILKRADSAMYKAKRAGGNRFAFFDPELQKRADLQLKIERDLEEAIKDNQFVAYFQPQVNAQGELIGAEALVRWLHPEEGIISPDNFISVAEQTGAIHRIQEIVLRQACELVLKVKESGSMHENCVVSINVSACQFELDLAKNITGVINEFGLPAEKFKLEITESLLMENVDLIVSKMRRLKEQGFKFSIDDFGTGYSSLAYLHSFPIDELKIDRSFINQIEDKGAAIIDAIISLSNSFGFDVVAEGVETLEQAKLLIAKNITSMQGYYYARPMTPEQFSDWIKDAKRCQITS